MIEVTNDIIGKEVVFTNSRLHETCPRSYPKFGTVGVVTEWIAPTIGFVFVQWPIGTTGGDGSWWCHKENLELYKKRCIKCI